MVFQNYALFPHMTVAGNVGYPLRLRGVAKAEIADRVQKVLELVQLGELGARNIDQLSGGQRQRVALARAIVFEPRILLMDEPLSALDKKLREEMQIEVRHLHQRLGMTTVYVTHDQREALTMSDRVAVIDKGRFHQIGSPRDVYERPESRFIAEFIGESHLVAVSMRGGTAHYRDRPLQLAEPPRHTSGQQFLVMRPEKLKLVTGGEPAEMASTCSRGQRGRSSTRARARCSMSTCPTTSRSRSASRRQVSGRRCRPRARLYGSACRLATRCWCPPSARHDHDQPR